LFFIPSAPTNDELTAAARFRTAHSPCLPDKASRFFHLDGLLFENVRWRLNLNDQGGTDSILLEARADDTCIASFHKNSFQVLGSAPSGPKTQLINSVYSESEPGNSVTATFRQFEYEAGFGSDGNSKIARVLEQGTWRFAKEDFQKSRSEEGD
jgi:hypothetical protein